MKKIVLSKIPNKTITNGIRIACANGSTEYRNIVEGQQEYEIPDVTQAVAAFVLDRVELKNVNE